MAFVGAHCNYMVVVVYMARLARCMAVVSRSVVVCSLVAVAIAAADCTNMGLVVVALFYSPYQRDTRHSQLRVSMEYNTTHACQ
jgi:hypothetical protein